MIDKLKKVLVKLELSRLMVQVKLLKKLYGLNFPGWLLGLVEKVLTIGSPVVKVFAHADVEKVERTLKVFAPLYKEYMDEEITFQDALRIRTNLTEFAKRLKKVAKQEEKSQ